MRDAMRRKIGIVAGVYLAIALLPGLWVEGFLGEDPEFADVALEGIMATAVLVVLGQIILISPSSDWRRAPVGAVLLLSVLGYVQDFLLWLLISWAFAEMESSLHVDGLGTIALAALLTRGLSLALLLLLPPSAEHREEAVAETA
ncbi:hypothetical protein [Streptomyces sp. NPDC091371]|uniref:hypothetical protein n=1 Tax=Streptomyces sp. NPDC091371 TaxID=3155303 RepID=UPI00342FA537